MLKNGIRTGGAEKGIWQLSGRWKPRSPLIHVFYRESEKGFKLWARSLEPNESFRFPWLRVMSQDSWQLALRFRKTKKFQNESRESVTNKSKSGACIPYGIPYHIHQRTVLSLTQLDNQGTFSSAEERLKGQNPMLRAKPSPLLSAVPHYQTPSGSSKVCSCSSSQLSPFGTHPCTGTIPDELLEASAALALGPFEQHQSSLGFPRILHNFWTILSVWHPRHPLSPLMFLPHKTELFSLLNPLH